MTGTIHANTIQKANGDPVDLTGQSAAKAWSSLNGRSTIAEKDSFNVSGYVDNGTGDYTYTISSDMSDANYSWTGVAGDQAGAGTFNAPGDDAQTAGTLTTLVFTFGGARTDRDTCNISINGDLA